MSSVSSCPGRIFVTIRRKKSALLGVTLVTAAVLLCLQYNVAKDAVDEDARAQPAPANLYLDTDKRVQEGRPQYGEQKPVQFIANSIGTDLTDQQAQFVNNYPQQQYQQPRQQVSVLGPYFCLVNRRAWA